MASTKKGYIVWGISVYLITAILFFSFNDINLKNFHFGNNDSTLEL